MFSIYQPATFPFKNAALTCIAESLIFLDGKLLNEKLSV